MKHSRLYILTSGAVEAVGFGLAILSTDEATTILGIGLVIAGALVAATVILFRSREAVRVQQYPAGEYMDVVLFED